MAKDKVKNLMLRLTIALVMGMVVTGVCLDVTWRAVGSYAYFGQESTEMTLLTTNDAVKAYRQKMGVLPRSLSQLKIVPDVAPVIQEGGVIWDSWQHPLVYQVRGSNYLIISYGRDGKPGGVGLDCDLSNVNPRPPEAELPFRQVIFHPLARGIIWASLLSGAVTFLLAFGIVRTADFSEQNIVGLVVKLFITLVATLMTAIVITAFHVPSGH